MKREQVAAQLYTVRDHLKTPQDIARALGKVRKIGYTAVQLSGVGPISEPDMVNLMKAEGLTCCATHENGQTILDDPQAIVRRLRALGCTYTAYPYPGGIDFNDTAAVQRLIAGLDAAGKVLADAGMVLTYHNHHIEFRRGGKGTILDEIYARTNPKHLQAEIDTYWVQAGGGDPVAWCRKLKGRLPLLHMKDLGIDSQTQQVFREIGNGNLDWKAIVAAAEGAGCRWFIVEQDGAWAGGDPFESLRISYDYITSNLCS
jgi:sugar phosphate isomerase/epimerase